MPSSDKPRGRLRPLRQGAAVLCLTVAAGLWVHRSSGAENFVLENDIGTTARFDFYEDTDSWEQKHPLVPPTWVQPRRHAHVNLPVDGEVVFRYTKVDNTASDTFRWNPGIALASSRETPPRVTFKGIVQRSVPQERTKTITVTRSVPEERTRTVTVPTLVSEQRTRVVRRRDPRTGRLVWEEEIYTVQVPTTKAVEETYTVMVPVMEKKTVTYTVAVPEAAARFDAGGKEFIASLTPTDDSRQRYQRVLGVQLADNRGALVTSVTPGSAAVRMTMFGPHAEPEARYALEPGVDRITRVNGVRVKTSREVVKAVQKSPASCILTVRNRSGEQTFEADLELVEVDEVPAPLFTPEQ